MVTKVAVGRDVLITGEAVHVRDTGHLGNLHFCTIFGEPTSALINEVFFFFLMRTICSAKIIHY